jgi:hypothetical protein
MPVSSSLRSIALGLNRADETPDTPGNDAGSTIANAAPAFADQIDTAATSGRLSPPLTESFAGPTQAQSLHIFPPDPSIAAGPTNVVVTVNDAIAWYDKSGTRESLETLDTFFGNTDSNHVFDPRVLYDQYNGHFYAVAALRDSTNQIVKLFVAESETSDPTQGWKTLSFNAEVSANGTNYYADYPTLAIDQNGLYITANYFALNSPDDEDGPLPDGVAGGSNSRMYFVTPDLASVGSYDPAAAVGLDNLTLQPAHTYGSQAAQSLTGTFLLAYQQNNSGDDTLNVIRINNAGPAAASFANTAIDVSDISDVFLTGNSAPQPNGALDINAGDNRVYSAVWRDGILYATTEIMLSGRPVVHWFEVNTSNMTLIDQGNVTADDLGANTSTYYGNIVVNGTGEFAIGFAASNANNVFPGAYYEIHSPTDPAGVMEGTQTLFAGQRTYVNTTNDPLGRNRWGDYSGAAVDPDDKSFWFFNEYASSIQNTWATQLGQIGFSVRNDFNADVKSDVLLQNTDGTPQVWLMNGAAVTSMTSLVNPGPSWHVAATGDFNLDGKADLLWQNNDGTPAIWEMNGTSVISGGLLANPGPSWHAIAAADFSDDGKADILWQNTDGAAALWLMNGTSIIGGGVLVNPGPSWHVIGAGDFNGDGHADILWQNADGAPAIWEMNGTSIIGGGVLINPGPSWHVIGTGDFNGDGNADILWQNTDGTPAIWEMNGTSIIGGGMLLNPGASWHVIGTSDFNGDGNADIIWQNVDGLPSIWEMNGTAIVGGGLLPNPGAAWQVKDDGPIPADQMTISPANNASPANGALHLSAPDLFAGAAGSELGDAAPKWPGAFLPSAAPHMFRT